MDWFAVLELIDQTMHKEQMSKEQAIEALIELTDHLDERIEALQDDIVYRGG